MMLLSHKSFEGCFLLASPPLRPPGLMSVLLCVCLLWVTWAGPEPAIVSPALARQDNVNEDTCTKGAIKVWKIEKVYFKECILLIFKWCEIKLKSGPALKVRNLSTLGVVLRQRCPVILVVNSLDVRKI